MADVVSNSIVEKSIARSWISSWTWSTVISCMRLKYGIAELMKSSATSVRAIARVGLARRRLLGVGEHRLEALPVRQRSQRRVGGHEVVQVRRAGARQPAR